MPSSLYNKIGSNKKVICGPDSIDENNKNNGYSGFRRGYDIYNLREKIVAKQYHAFQKKPKQGRVSI